MDKVVKCFTCSSSKEIRNKYINEVLMFTAKKKKKQVLIKYVLQFITIHSRKEAQYTQGIWYYLTSKPRDLLKLIL